MAPGAMIATLVNIRLSPVGRTGLSPKLCTLDFGSQPARLAAPRLARRRAAFPGRPYGGASFRTVRLIYALFGLWRLSLQCISGTASGSNPRAQLSLGLC
jgi:hypothetical protein